MPTTEGDHEGAVPEGAGAQRTPVDHSSRRLHTREIDDLVEAALSERMPTDRLRQDVPMADPYVGVEVDRRYVIESLIAAGGMGLVYRCRHRVLGKKLAMKIIRSDVAHMPDGSERFMLEAKAASSVGNEHIVDIGDFGAMPDGSPYLVMEYLEGISLAALLRRQSRLGIARLAGIASQIAEGLGAAHAAGIVHRDLKPDNVFVLDRKGDDFIKVLDFGVARMAQNAKKLTQAGTIVGTPHYMSPEQALGLEVDHRGDIYALGIIMYEMIAGRVPFDGDHYVAVLHQHLQTPPPAFSSLDPPLNVPSGLERVVGKCLAKTPEDRYATMAELARDLAAFRGTSLVRLGPASEAPRPSAAHSLPPALPAPDLVRVAHFNATARLAEPEPPQQPPSPAPPLSPAPPPSPLPPPLPSPVVTQPPAAAASATPRDPTLALPRPSGPFTLPQKRFVTTLSVAVLLGVCALAALRVWTSPGERTPGEEGSRADVSRAPAPAPASRWALPDPGEPAVEPEVADPALARGDEAAASTPVPAAGSDLPAAPTPAPPSSDAASAPATTAASRAPRSAGSEPRPKTSAPARERREASPAKRGSSRPVSKPRARDRELDREEFMNPWPAPRR